MSIIANRNLYIFLYISVFYNFHINLFANIHFRFSDLKGLFRKAWKRKWMYQRNRLCIHRKMKNVPQTRNDWKCKSPRRIWFDLSTFISLSVPIGFFSLLKLIKIDIRKICFTLLFFGIFYGILMNECGHNWKSVYFFALLQLWFSQIVVVIPQW